jgi:hypothetical protein
MFIKLINPNMWTTSMHCPFITNQSSIVTMLITPINKIIVQISPNTFLKKTNMLVKMFKLKQYVTFSKLNNMGICF